ncbi:DUF922 domain-containing protein [Bizionia arctica]|uniref:DUF922 domain-containing protein n=1 Tax=Bizionia arctica TaxID=1495645 RepID=A0A917LSZ4_9FLAO|nr:DUF922 domain-containing protein [Bizionia arctica]GGG53614.1 hypothetical protein GCM10010976_25720 [Bizionia arctica]
MWLRKIGFFILLGSWFFSFSQNEEPVIIWEESNKLSWENFKEKPEPNSDAVAITASGITFQYAVQTSDNQITGFTTQVQTLFYPEKSWCKPERTNAHILSHEQLHFDITEWHARKFKQQIKALEISEKLPKNLDALYKNSIKDLNKMQDLYDSETDYSRKIEAQAKWQEQVHKELTQLSNFKSSN